LSEALDLEQACDFIQYLGVLRFDVGLVDGEIDTVLPRAKEHKVRKLLLYPAELRGRNINQ